MTPQAAPVPKRVAIRSGQGAAATAGLLATMATSPMTAPSDRSILPAISTTVRAAVSIISGADRASMRTKLSGAKNAGCRAAVTSHVRASKAAGCSIQPARRVRSLGLSRSEWLMNDEKSDATRRRLVPALKRRRRPE